jgi:HK97 family phage portal protein
MKSLKNLWNLAPVPFVSRAAAQTRSFVQDSGTFSSSPARQMEVIQAVSTLFAIVSANSTSVAAAEWGLFRKAQSGKKEDRVPVTAHPALVVWNKPNDFYNQTQFIETEQQHVDLTGEGYWVLYSDPRAPSLGPTEIWPVRPDRMFPVKHPTKFLTGWVYRSPDGEEIPLDTDEVIQLRMPNPNDPYRGMGPVQSLMTTLQGYGSAMTYNRNFFLNGAEPGGIVEFTDDLDDDQWLRHKRRWNSQHQGVARAHRVAILEGGAKWVDRKYTNRDMEFLGLVNFSRDVIREAFGIHKHILGQSDDVNLANALAADTTNAKRQEIPRLNRFRSALNGSFLPKFRGTENLEFDYCDPTPENSDEQNKERESKANTYKTLVDAGVAPDDAAQVAGLPPMRTAPRPAPTPPPAPVASLQNAQRWVARAENDDNTCEPCRENDGKLYRNRADAYADYPGGSNYVDCVGEQYGNQCRCKVVKRGREE